VYQAQLAQAKKSSTASGDAPHLDAAKRRAEERLQAAAQFQEQSWQKVVVDSDDTDVEEASGEALECVACGKTFQSEASWANHERSKKHKQAVYR